MIIKPMIRSNMCFTSHPDGCEKNVKEQIEYVKSKQKIEGTKKALIIGASTGYGLASRIVAAYGCGADTVGVFFERNAEENRTASAGLYNSAAFEKFVSADGSKSFSINGDAFSDEVKEKTINLLKKEIGKVDLVVYSIASPKRTHPKTGETYASALKPIGKKYTTKALNFITGKMSDVSIEPANEEEIEKTVIVMGGEDWTMWIDALLKADLLAKDAVTVAYSYVGPTLTFPIYRDGTIGRAKEDLEKTAFLLSDKMKNINGKAYVSVNKGLVTQASSAIPAVPLYISLLFKVMKEKNLHEDCIHQIYRLYKDFLYNKDGVKTDSEGRIRIDDWEMKPEIQKEVADLWAKATDENIGTISDLDGYRKDFYRLFGFEMDGIDYTKDVDPQAKIKLI